MCFHKKQWPTPANQDVGGHNLETTKQNEDRTDTARFDLLAIFNCDGGFAVLCLARPDHRYLPYLLAECHVHRADSYPDCRATEGGDNWAVIATLIENCKLAGINPHTWLTATLTSLADVTSHPGSANSCRGSTCPENSAYLQADTQHAKTGLALAFQLSHSRRNRCGAQKMVAGM